MAPDQGPPNKVNVQGEATSLSVPKQNKDTSVLRTWTDSTGRHTTEARFGGTSRGKVKLIKEDGINIEVPLDKLSDEDQQWIEDRGKPRLRDRIELQNGGSMECIVLQQGSTDVTILYRSSVIRVPRTSVASIVRDADSAALRLKVTTRLADQETIVATVSA